MPGGPRGPAGSTAWLMRSRLAIAGVARDVFAVAVDGGDRRRGCRHRGASRNISAATAVEATSQTLIRLRIELSWWGRRNDSALSR